MMTTRSILSLPTAAFLAVPVLLAAPLTACSPATPEQLRASDIVRCKEQFGMMTTSPQQADALCGCMEGKLEERGLESGTMFGGGSEAAKQVYGLCAQQVGVPAN